MKTIKELKNSMPQKGRISWIGIRQSRRAELEVVKSNRVSTDHGLEGDHYGRKGGKRLVTLIQKEHLDTVSSILSKPVLPSDIRRNIVVSGINLLALKERKFKLGDDVILEGTGYCHPCSRMEENLGPGGYNAMRGHGGLTAKVVVGGTIKLDDLVEVFPLE